MPPSLRILLPSFALAAIVLGCAASASPALLKGGRDRSARPTAIVDKARPERSRVRTPTLGDRAARMALRAVGVPYRWGGASLEGGFDCSGLVYWTYSRLGIDLPHSSYALYARGRRVARSRMKPGDLLFFSGLGHVGIYVGRGRMVHAPQSGRTVEVVRLGRSSYGRDVVGARRLAGA
jgi:cell wall-associated NlpC family hydrolase